MEKDCFTLVKSKGKGGNRNDASSFDKAEASSQEDASVGGFG